jgi:hypothetical protein
MHGKSEGIEATTYDYKQYSCRILILSERSTAQDTVDLDSLQGRFYSPKHKPVVPFYLILPIALIFVQDSPTAYTLPELCKKKCELKFDIWSSSTSILLYTDVY